MTHSLKFIVTILGLSFLISCANSSQPKPDFHFQNDGKGFIEITMQNIDSVALQGRLGKFGQLKRKEISKEFHKGDTTILFKNKLVLPSDAIWEFNDEMLRMLQIPGDTVKISINQISKDSLHLDFTGKYKTIQKYRYLLEKQSDNQHIKIFNNFSISLSRYKSKIDSFFYKRNTFLEAHKQQLPEWFYNIEKNNFQYLKLGACIKQPAYRNFKNNPTKVPENYFNFMDTIDVKDLQISPLFPSNGILSSYFIKKREMHYAEMIDTSYLNSSHKAKNNMRRNYYKKQYLAEFDRNPSELDTSLHFMHYSDRCELKYKSFLLRQANNLLDSTAYNNYIPSYVYNFQRFNPDEREHIKGIIDTSRLSRELNQFLTYLSDTLDQIQKKKPVPDFYLPDARDNYHKLSDYKGQVVLLNIWSNGCKPCVAKLDEEKKLVESFSKDSFKLVKVIFAQKQSTMAGIKERFNPGGLNLYTPGQWPQKIKKKYQVTAYPTYLLIDKKGNIVNHNPPIPGDPKLNKVIKKYL